MTRTPAQRRAERRYHQKRGNRPMVSVPLTDEQDQWLERQRQEDESRAAAMRRLSGMPGVNQ